MTSIETTPIYIAFPDGVYHFVCRECTTVCCRNSAQFDGDLKRELVQLRGLYPTLEYAAVRQRGDALTFAAPSGHCFFLTEGNRCGIELDHGKELKPLTCTLFPFHSLLLLGGTVVVTPNFLCPLRLEVPARPGEVEGTHAKIESQLRNSHYLRQSFLPAIPHLTVPAKTKATEVLAREIAFRDACSAALNRSRFRDVVYEFSASKRILEESVTRRGQLLELDYSGLPASRDRVDDLLLAISPGLRLKMTILPPELILGVLLLFELWFRRILTLTGDVPRGLADAATPKGANDLFGNVLPALWLLTLSGERIRLRSTHRHSLTPFGDAQMTFAAYRILNSANHTPLELSVVEEALSTLPTIAEKMVLLTDVGSKLAIDVRKGRRPAAAV